MWEDDSEVGIDADMVSGSYTIFRCCNQDIDTKSLMNILLRDLTLAWVELNITSFSVKSWYTSNIHKYTVHHYNHAYGILESKD